MNTLEKVQKLKETIKDYPNIKIIAACKYFDVEKTKEIVEAGITDIGENRKEQLMAKSEELKNYNVTYHFIGNLTSRSCYDTKFVNLIDYLHTLESIDVAQAINKKRTSPLKCFIKVDMYNNGLITPEKLLRFVKQLARFENIQIVGLMTIAKLTFDEEELNRCFKTLKELQLKVQELALEYAPCTELSMGMSNDYLIALKNGATMIRIGRKFQ